MKYKLPKPEDYPDIEEFSFKLSRAYSKLYVDAHAILIMIDNAVQALKTDDPIDRAVAIKMLEGLLKEHKA